MTVTLTDDERALLRGIHARLCETVAEPDAGVLDLRLGRGGGGYQGFGYTFTDTGVVGEWREFGADPDRPGRTRVGAVQRQASVSYRRLRSWALSLPAEVRAQARVWWRVHPVETRDLPSLRALILAQLADPAPVVAEPVDLLDLLATDAAATA